ncbi:hypothetical protein, partial [Desulfobotulus alkaliphilus]|uniref:hypothetical protein n=1 Tax=Desulfobotulus alkaliphilus TaxID=622671 RepID=UPI001C95A4AF
SAQGKKLPNKIASRANSLGPVHLSCRYGLWKKVLNSNPRRVTAFCHKVTFEVTQKLQKIKKCRIR